MVKQKDFDELKEKVDLLEISFNDIDGCVDGLGVKYKKLSERLSALELELHPNSNEESILKNIDDTLKNLQAQIDALK